ncbi:hypothetical protein EVC14_055 [Rhizobium phage RHph_I3_18]|nr:hypothetical protein EVC14_055 [Rhizobium phage RHph_I3_18]
MTKLIDLLKSGLDTVEIAEHLGGLANGWSESKVYNAMAREKAAELKRRAALPKIRYAGYERGSVTWGGR